MARSQLRSSRHRRRTSARIPPRIAVIIPCHNEEAAVASVVHGVRRGSSPIGYLRLRQRQHRSHGRGRSAAGAHVRHEHIKGKGNVIRRAFADVDAEIYVLIDGDDTYATDALPAMITALQSGPFDHVLGVRSGAHPHIDPVTFSETARSTIDRLGLRCRGQRHAERISVLSRRSSRVFRPCPADLRSRPN